MSTTTTFDLGEKLFCVLEETCTASTSIGPSSDVLECGARPTPHRANFRAMTLPPECHGTMTRLAWCASLDRSEGFIADEVWGRRGICGEVWHFIEV